MKIINNSKSLIVLNYMIKTERKLLVMDAGEVVENKHLKESDTDFYIKKGYISKIKDKKTKTKLLPEKEKEPPLNLDTMEKK